MELTKNTKPSAEQVEVWKKEYKRVKRIRVVLDLSVYGESGTEEHWFFFKPVDRNIKSLADKKLIDENRQVNTDGYAEVIISGHLLNGQEVFAEDLDVRYALLQKAEVIVTSATATLVKN